MTKKRFVEFYLTAMMKAATAGYVHRLGYLYYDMTRKEAVKVYREDDPLEIDVTGLELVEIAKAVLGGAEMSPDTKTEVGRIAAAICDSLCHWPRVLGEAELSEKCDGCRPIIDIANLAEKLEDPRERERERERESYRASSALRGGQIDHP